jgi:hypothetical protein
VAFRLRCHLTRSDVNHIRVVDALLDQMMPAMSLWQFLRHGQRESTYALVPVVIPQFSPWLADRRPMPGRSQEVVR